MGKSTPIDVSVQLEDIFRARHWICTNSDEVCDVLDRAESRTNKRKPENLFLNLDLDTIRYIPRTTPSRSFRRFEPHGWTCSILDADRVLTLCRGLMEGKVVLYQ